MKKKSFVVFCLLVACGGLLVGCHNKNKANIQDEEVAVTPPTFCADSAFAYVKAQTDFGPRTLGSEAHDNCRDYLVQQLAAFCDTAFVQNFNTKTYDGKSWACSNIIGSFNKDNPQRILLSAHWDSRPFADRDPNQELRNQPIDGANDGASGVGVLLEVARQLRTLNPAIGVDFVFFDAEDYGPRENHEAQSPEEAPKGEWWCLGSQYWAQHPHVTNYTARYGILLDMVGSFNPCFMQEFFSLRDAQPIVAKVWSTAYSLGYSQAFINSPGGMITDDHYYVNKYTHIPMIDIIQYNANTGTGFDPVWHTHNDNIQHIDKNTLDMVGKTLLQVIKNEQ